MLHVTQEFFALISRVLYDLSVSTHFFFSLSVCMDSFDNLNKGCMRT